jgi:hypothetical protein
LARWLEQEPGPDIVRIPLLLKMYLGRSVSDERLSGFVTSYRHDHEAHLDRYRQLHAELDAAGMREAHVVRYGLYHEEAVLRWLDSLPWNGRTPPTTPRRRPKRASPNPDE